MDDWEKFWMCFLIALFGGVGLSLINLYANSLSDEAFRRGYQEGYSQRAGGICDSSFITCDRAKASDAGKTK